MVCWGRSSADADAGEEVWALIACAAAAAAASASAADDDDDDDQEVHVVGGVVADEVGAGVGMSEVEKSEHATCARR